METDSSRGLECSQGCSTAQQAVWRVPLVPFLPRGPHEGLAAQPRHTFSSILGQCPPEGWAVKSYKTIKEEKIKKGL